MKHIYISPHADDVALSCGGQILANPDHSDDSLIITVFTSRDNPASNTARRDRARFQGSVHADRDSEDDNAWTSVGVTLRLLGLPEALLRGSFPFSLSRSAGDRHVMAELQDLISIYMRTFPEASFYFPAGIGRHVDHLLCRDVALAMLARDASSKILFYEDAPYWWLRFLRKAHYRELGPAAARDVANAPGGAGIGLLQYLSRQWVPFPRGKMLFLALNTALLAGAARPDKSKLKTFSPTVTTKMLDEEILGRKRALVYKYKSQLPMLFGQKPDELIAHYEELFATERIIELSREC